MQHAPARPLLHVPGHHTSQRDSHCRWYTRLYCPQRKPSLLLSSLAFPGRLVAPLVCMWLPYVCNSRLECLNWSMCDRLVSFWTNRLGSQCNFGSVLPTVLVVLRLGGCEHVVVHGCRVRWQPLLAEGPATAHPVPYVLVSHAGKWCRRNAGGESCTLWHHLLHLLGEPVGLLVPVNKEAGLLWPVPSLASRKPIYACMPRV